MKFQNQVNAVGAVSVGVMCAFLAYDFTRSRDTPPCPGRFRSATELSLTTPGGTVLTPAELEARVGVGEQGVKAKASVVSAKGQPSPQVLNVAVGGAVATDTGASFFWSPSGNGHQPAACLSYDFYLPSNFDFARGGRLPGLFGGTFGGVSAPSPRGLGVHITWDEIGQAGVEGVAALPADRTDVTPFIRFTSQLELPRGRWVHVDQEVNVGEPNQPNGIYRLWIDGQLKVEDINLIWRQDDSVGLNGAWADIGYQSFGGIERKSNSESSIKVTPPRLSWE